MPGDCFLREACILDGGEEMAVPSEAGALSAAQEGLALIAHELRAPLTSLQLLTEDLLGTMDERAGDVSRLLRIVQGMSVTLDSLLDAALLGHQSLDWHDVDLAECCRDAMELVRPQMSPLTSMTLDVEQRARRIRGNPETLRRLVANLAGNACRHTPSGRVQVEAHVTEAHWTEISVSDTGMGMDAEGLSRLGQPFARGADRPAGSGLGLWICRGIAGMYAGSLMVWSSRGAGMTVTARLRNDLERAAEAAGPAPISVASRQAAREAA